MNYKDYITPKEKKLNKKLRNLTDEEHFILRKDNKIRSIFSTTVLICLLFIPYIKDFFDYVKIFGLNFGGIITIINLYSNVFFSLIIGGFIFLIFYIVQNSKDKLFFKIAREIKNKLK